MKNRILSSSDDEDGDSSKSSHFWWRLSTKYEESMKVKVDISKMSSLTPRIKLIREMERLGLLADEGVDELRHKLRNYRSGDLWVPVGGLKKEEMDIPPTTTILLVGFSGSGKSSLVNLMYSVLGRSALISFSQTSGGKSKYTTLLMEEHNVLRSLRCGFCVFDTRGLDYKCVGQSLEEVSGWMTDGVHHNQLCLRPGDVLSEEDDSDVTSLTSPSKFATRSVNCAMFVANVAEIYKAFKAGNLKPLEATKAVFSCPALRKCSESPLLILTHGDVLSADERIEGRLKICEYLGISEATGVYDIVCSTEYGLLTEQSDPIAAYVLTEAVYRALLISDRSLIPKRNWLDWALIVLSTIAYLIASLLAFLAHILSRIGHKHRIKL